MTEENKIYYRIVLIFALGILLFALFGNPLSKTQGMYQISSTQAQYVGASANSQWQNAMSWVRNNTGQKDIFVHWWDYGYFIQTLGERPSVTDGGHAAGQDGNHYIGRYILTTSNPKTALSFMKTWNVSYLLIDPTEMGKYGAFSKIGSNDSWDRISTGIFGGASDEKQSQETADGIAKVYQLGGCVDSDISYINNDSKVFLPGISISKTQQMQCNSYIIGAIINFKNSKNQTDIEQPIGVYIYNNKQYRVPLRYVYLNGQMIDFKKGIDSVVYLIPRINEQKGNIDETGAMIYLSPRTFNSLVGRLYILDDYYKEYPTLKEAVFEDDPAVSYFKQFTGGKMNEFIWYQGIRAPLKIWKVDYPLGTEVHKEFITGREEIVNFGGKDYLFE